MITQTLTRTRTTRTDRARQLLEAGAVLHDEGNRFFVLSQSDADTTYTVDLDLPSCDCPDLTHLCKHIRAAQMAREILERGGCNVHA